MVPRRARPSRIAAVVIVTLAAGALAIAAGQPVSGGPDLVVVDVGRQGAPISPTMFGLFFEDINFAADGGLYPERVKNRAFEFDEPLSGWQKLTRPFTAAGELAVRTEAPLNASTPHYLRLRGFKDGTFGVANAGFRGIGLEAGASYVFSAYVRVPTGGVRGVSVRLAGPKGQTLAEATLSGFTGAWARYETVMVASDTEPRAQLEIHPQGEGELDLDVVSLFPKDTFKGTGRTGCARTWSSCLPT